MPISDSHYVFKTPQEKTVKVDPAANHGQFNPVTNGIDQYLTGPYKEAVEAWRHYYNKYGPGPDGFRGMWKDLKYLANYNGFGVV